MVYFGHVKRITYQVPRTKYHVPSTTYQVPRTKYHVPSLQYENSKHNNSKIVLKSFSTLGWAPVTVGMA